MDFLTIGGLLVEIMRKETEKPLNMPADFTGPYPSGDVAIFIDVAARLGGKAAIIGAVGKDDFGKCLLERLAKDGVDTSYITENPDATTGTAFVAYFDDGSRDFIYHWKDAAAGLFDMEIIKNIPLNDVKWFHCTGVNLSLNEESRNAIYYILDHLPKETVVSFDPNIRPEVLSEEEIIKLCKPAMERANIFFPSFGEASMFTQSDNDDDGCKKLAKQGKLVVLKMGAYGCKVYHEDKTISAESFNVEEVDPTGAGDSFCAGFLVALNDGLGLEDAARFANAVGALAVTKQGPMEGCKNKQEVLDFINSHK